MELIYVITIKEINQFKFLGTGFYFKILFSAPELPQYPGRIKFIF